MTGLNNGASDRVKTIMTYVYNYSLVLFLRCRRPPIYIFEYFNISRPLRHPNEKGKDLNTYRVGTHLGNPREMILTSAF